LRGILLYTPGHSPYTDTLIAYGLAYALRDAPELEIRGRGTHYEVLVEAEIEDVATCIRRVFRERAVAELRGDVLRRLLAGRDVDQALRALEDGGLLKYLYELTEPGHSRREGRHGKGSTFKLPLMPLAGKYLHTDLTAKTKYDAKQYKACKWCSALAMLGLATGALTLSFGTSRVVVLFSFEGAVDREYLATFFEFLESLKAEREEGRTMLEDLRYSLDSIPDRLLAYSLTTYLSKELVLVMSVAAARWRALVVRFDTRRAVQVRGFQDVELNSVIGSLEEIIRLDEEEGTDTWGRLGDLIRRLMRRARARDSNAHHALDSLTSLFDFLASRRAEYLYEFARSGYKAFNRSFNVYGLCESLLRIC